MKRITFLSIALFLIAGVLAFIRRSSGYAEEKSPPVSGFMIPLGYRDWRLVSVAHEAGDLNDIRAVLGNDKAIKAYRDRMSPFPDGAIIARLAWSYVRSEENNKVFGREQSFVAGPPINVQFMVKDSRKYASTGGWGFAEFTDERPAKIASPNTCSSCHELARARDFVFTRYTR